MTNPTITREQLIAAIEAGIERAGFPEPINDALRTVGKTATSVGVGSFCDCPATLVGLFPTSEYYARWGDRFGDVPLDGRAYFATVFDNAVNDFVVGQSHGIDYIRVEITA